MNLLENEIYLNDIKYISKLNLPWNKLESKTVLISGASGLIGSCLVDTIMYLNNIKQLNTKIIAIGRSEEKAKERFKNYWNSKLFKFINLDINQKLNIDDESNFILHLASNTHPKAYSTDPIGTILTNIIGTNNLLEYAVSHDCERFVFTSTCEIYGENKGDVEKFNEKYCGYIDCNTLRAGYPEGKRCGEALCQAYKKQENLDVVIPRLPRTFGPTMLMSSSNALSQFIKNGINKEDIVLKSEGNQYYSYMYVVDAVSAIFTIMLKGVNGESYNIADESCDGRLKEIANIISNYVGTKVIFEFPDEVEKSGYSVVTKSLLDNKKIKKLGWKCSNNIEEGLKKTIDVLKLI